MASNQSGVSTIVVNARSLSDVTVLFYHLTLNFASTVSPGIVRSMSAKYKF